MERSEFTKLTWCYGKYSKCGLVSIPVADLDRAIIETNDNCFRIWWIGASKQTIIVKENPIKLLEQEG